LWHSSAVLEPPASRAFLFEGMLGALLILGPAIGIGVALDSDAGSIADWVAGVATTLAFVAAVFAARSAQRMLRVEQDRDARAQAGRVATWHEEPWGWEPNMVKVAHHADGTATWEDDGTYGVASLGVRVLNASDMPIFEVAIVGKLDFVDPETGAIRSSPFEHDVGRLAPNSDRGDLYSVRLERRIDPFQPGKPAPALQLEVVFRDTFGVVWRRTEMGALTALR
jgi:hypothetical protein